MRLLAPMIPALPFDVLIKIRDSEVSASVQENEKSPIGLTFSYTDEYLI